MIDAPPPPISWSITIVAVHWLKIWWLHWLRLYRAYDIYRGITLKGTAVNLNGSSDWLAFHSFFNWKVCCYYIFLQLSSSMLGHQSKPTLMRCVTENGRKINLLTTKSQPTKMALHVELHVHAVELVFISLRLRAFSNK